MQGEQLEYMERTLTKFDLEAAFKALDEIEIPEAKTGRMSRNEINLKETFKRPTLGAKTEALVEEFYDVPGELPEAKAEREDEIAKAKLARIEKIVDLDAETPEDILPSYEGKIIIQCPQCMTLFYKDVADIEKSDNDESICNVGEKCQHCGNEDGYTIIGKVAAAEIPVEDLPEEEKPEEESGEEKAEEPTEKPAEENKDEEVEEENKEESEEADLNLDLEEIPEEEEKKKEESLQIEGQPLTEDKISAAEIKDRLASFIKDDLHEECAEEKIIKGDEPLKEANKEVSDAEFKKLINSRIWNEDLEDAGRQVDEIAAEIEDAGAEEEIKEEEKEDPIKEELTSDPEEIERRLEQKADELQYEDLDEESFNEQITSCLNKIYKNTESFKATDCSLNENSQLIIEGNIKFKSGKEKGISFVCEAYNKAENNKIGFKLVSEALNDVQIFTNCSLNENKSLLTESCEYSIKKKLVENRITELLG